MATERLRVSWRSVYTEFEDCRRLSEQELAGFLSHSKLLQIDYRRDRRWQGFYRFFRVLEDGGGSDCDSQGGLEEPAIDRGDGE